MNNEQSEKEIRKTISFTITSKIKSLTNEFDEGSDRPVQ
jgi:hypothetical protein